MPARPPAARRVGHLRVLVPPRSEHRTVLADEERPPRHASIQRHTRAAPKRFASAPFHRRGAARRRRARPSRPGATSASRERRRRPALPPARTPAACHAGGAAPGFRSATSRRGRRRSDRPSSSSSSSPPRRRCRARTRAESTRCATAIKVGSTTPAIVGKERERNWAETSETARICLAGRPREDELVRVGPPDDAPAAVRRASRSPTSR